MKKILAILSFAMLSALAFAQGFNVKLTLQDATSPDPVPFATVSLTPENAQKASKYVLSDENGVATIEKVRKGNYTLRAELLGFKPFSQVIKVVDKDIDLGIVKVEPDSQLLDAASISAVGNPITVKKDTIEYNASSFKTTDNDMLENLLKKLPGVEVGSDGTVTVNGKTINKITIDGKTFFLDDPSLATKNIPAKIVEKVKVVDKKSDQAMFTGIDDGEEETVIDLSIKKGMMKGWFGNVMGGGGHDIQEIGYGQPGRWQGAAMVGNFTDKQQISVILNANNTNNRGFNDMAGNMMSQMRGGGGGMGRGGGMWGNNSGILTSWMGGLNGAWSLVDGRMDLGANYLYNGTNKDVIESSHKIDYRDSGKNMIYDSEGFSNTMSQGHRFGVRLDHKFSDRTSLLFEPQFNFGNGTFNEYSSTATSTQVGEVIDETNRGFTNGAGNNRNLTASGMILFRQKITDKPGRTLSAFARYSFSNNYIEGLNQSLTEIMKGGSWTPTFTNQRYDGKTTSASIRSRLAYTEPLVADRLFLELSYGYNWSRNNQIKHTYDSGTNNLYNEWDADARQMLAYNYMGELYNDIYSKDIVNNSQTHRAGAVLQYQDKKLRVQLGAQFQPTITDNTTNGKEYHNVKYNWSPQAMLNYDFNEKTNIRLWYRGRSEQPSTSQLMPVPDNSNPLNVSFGNPYLTPYFNHSIRTEFGHTNKKTFFSIRGNIDGNITQDGISNAQWYDEAGRRYSMPLNGPVVGSVNFNYFLNSPIAKSGFSVSNMGFVSFNSSAAYVGRDAKCAELTTRYYDSETADFNYEQFHADFFGAGHAYNLEDYFITNRTRSLSVTERIKFTYRNDFVEVGAAMRTRMNKPWYTIENETGQGMTWANSAQAEMLWTIPGGVGINADARYNWYVGYVSEQKPECVINAELTKLLFKNKVTLALKVYDLLNQSRTLNVSDTNNVHSEVRNNTLGRYVIVSLTYRFGNIGGAGKYMQGGQGGRGGQGGPGGGRGGYGGPRR